MTALNDILIWAESEAEARDFIDLLGNDLKLKVTGTFVAKKSKGKRDVGYRYTEGVYFPFNTLINATSDNPIIAPGFITELVQWCSPDIILSTPTAPILCLETTFHTLTFNNVAQRIPRVVRGSFMKVPSVIFQKVDYSFGVGLTWFIKTFLNASKISDHPCMAIVFNDEQYEDARTNLINLVDNACNHQEKLDRLTNSIMASMENLTKDYSERTLLYSQNGRRRNWLEVDNRCVIVHIGVRDNCALTGIPGYGCQGDVSSRADFRKALGSRGLGEKGCVWLSKGTGGMDPYPGLVKMSELLLCYDEKRNRSKKLISRFDCLPADFWWFEHNPNEIYYGLIKEFSDEVQYTDNYK
jgi:hypothetical protein